MDVHSLRRGIDARAYIAAVVVAMALVGTLGYLHYERWSSGLEHDAERTIDVIARHKAEQVAGWWNQRRHDAATVQIDQAFALHALEFFETGDHTDELSQYLASQCDDRMYSSAALYDSSGARRIGHADEGVVDDPTAQETISRALASRSTQFSDLHYCPISREPTIDMAIPLRTARDGSSIEVGVFLLRIDIATTLYPIVSRWPVPSESGEALLIRREGDSVVFLSPLAHSDAAPLSLRIPMQRTDVIAVKAAGGDAGQLRGNDYRGVPVLAVVKPIRGTTWQVIAKVDSSEVDAPIRKERLVTIGGVVLVLLTLVAFLALLWRNQRVEHFRLRYLAETERRALVEHFDRLVRHANDMIMLSDDLSVITDANEAACRGYGYSREELIGLPLVSLIAPESLAWADEVLERITRGESMVVEATHLRKDGSKFPVELSARAFDIDGKRYFQAIVRDVTESKRANALIRESEARLSMVVSSLPVVFFVIDENGVFRLSEGKGLSALGLSPGQVVGMSIDDVYRDVPEVIEFYRRHLAGGPSRRELVIGPSVFDTHMAHATGPGGAPETIGAAIDITEAKLAEKQLKDSLEEKEILLREIHHRVKNNMQVMSSLLHMQSRQTDDPAVKAIFADAEARIASMALIHEQLYHTGRFANIDMVEYASSLTRNITASHATSVGQVAIQVEGNLNLPLSLAVPCGLVINELAVNAIKHAFPDGRKGTVRIVATKAEGDNATLTVADDGVGMQQQAARYGAPALGMRLVRLLVERQLEGRVETASGDEGTEITVAFPVRV